MIIFTLGHTSFTNSQLTVLLHVIVCLDQLFFFFSFYLFYYTSKIYNVFLAPEPATYKTSKIDRYIWSFFFFLIFWFVHCFAQKTFNGLQSFMETNLKISA